MGFTRESVNGPKQPVNHDDEVKADEVPGDRIPLELRSLKQWLCWRFILKAGKTKPDKVPFSAFDPSRPCDHTAPSSWSTYDDAVAAAADPANGFDGIGFEVTEEDPYLGIDFDHVIRPDGTFEHFFYDATMSLGSYCERTPSGDGLRLWIKARFSGGDHKKSGLGDKKNGSIEFYDRKRFFTVTGNAINRCSDVLDKSAEFLAYHARVCPPRPKAESTRSNIPISLDDQAIIDKIKSGKHGPKYAAMYDQGAHDADGGQNSADLSLASQIAFYTQGDPVATDRIFRGSALMRPKWDERRGERTYGENTIAIVCNNQYRFHDPNYRSLENQRKPNNAVKPAEPGPGEDGTEGQEYVDGLGELRNRRDDLPDILVTTKHGEVNDAGIVALERDPTLFSRGQFLVTIIFDCVYKKSKIRGKEPQPHVMMPIERTSLRERLSRVANWTTMKKVDGEWDQVPSPVPEWAANAIFDRKQWPDIRPLEGVADSPCIVSGGRILQDPGYDEESGIFYRPNGDYPQVNQNPTREDVDAAVAEIYEVFRDFPFKKIGDDGGAGHRAAYLSSILTLVARHSIAGPCPMFPISGNAPGIGKGFLVDAESIIVTGYKAAKMFYPDKEEEMEKRLTAIAIEGTPIIVFDNIPGGGSIGGPALDMALTAQTYRGRLLGRNEFITAPMRAVFFATGNNIGFRGDIGRRIVPIGLESNHQRPEERDDFKVDGDFIEYVTNNRIRILMACLTILRGHVVAGSPKAKLKPMSFVAWSDVIRSAVHWATGIDPCITRNEKIQEDPEMNQMEMLLRGWSQLCEYHERQKGAKGLTTTEAYNILSNPANSERFPDLSEALGLWGKDGRLPAPISIGMKFKGIKDRPIDGMFLRSYKPLVKQLWYVEDTTPEKRSTEAESEQTTVVEETDENSGTF